MMTTENYSMDYYINNGDLPGAYERFQTTSASWKSRWWNVVEKIFNKVTGWANYFVLDPINRVLKRITRGRLPSIENVVKGANRLSFNVPAEGCGAYIVKHFDKEDKMLWTKCGKADDAITRLTQHFKNDYYGRAERGVVVGWYPCKNANHALTVENIIRDHFQKKGFKLLGNDRFPTLYEITEEDFAELERKIKIVEEIF